VNVTVSRAEIAAGVLAGLAGGILIGLFLFGVQILGGQPPADVVAQTYRGIASVLLGPAAVGYPAAPAIGLVLHFAVSISWALGYVYLARTKPQLLARPWISGAAFGVVVYIFMQLILLTAGMYHRPGLAELATSLIAHMLCYGIPVALIVSRRLSPTHAAA